jgi:ubiquinone/menaquinone biosynthesis C-methylase UbiE/uncharacterized protein YbaR (Trm112 family)
MEWISILQCPLSGEALQLVSAEGIKNLHQKMASGQLWQVDGQPISQSFNEALCTSSGNYFYPIINSIVILLKDLALVTSSDKISTATISADKLLVKNFYDQKGWLANEQGHYEDAVIFEDLRLFAQPYIKKCHARVTQHLLPTGTYMVDAASGALQYEDYLPYSNHYQYRVCIDFSFQALQECKRKLGDKAICLLADITQLPIKENAVQGFVSLNTIYHIPKNEQVTAIKELYRILAPKAKGVVVYEWFKHSAWMNFWMFPFRAFVYLKNRIADGLAKLFGKKNAGRRLYFYAHSPTYMRQHLPPYKLVVWRSLSVHFMRYYLHAWLFGEKILTWVYNKEEQQPQRCGEKGEYPMMVFEK